LSPPSSFFLTERERLRQAAQLGPVLDLACGRGRHALAAARDGLATLGVDRNPEFLRALAVTAHDEKLPLQAVRADLESGTGIPVQAGACGAILVFRFLFRELSREIVKRLCPGGLLLYETFTIHQRELGYGPSNPDFLLQPGELPSLFPELVEVYSWEGVTGGEKPWAVARLLAQRPLDATSASR